MSQYSTSDKKILIVEDETIIARNLSSKLRKYGFQVSGIARNARETFSLISREQPDLLLMDINLNSELDGIEISNIINKTSNLPVIFITAYSDRETLERARLANPYSYIIKPFKITEVVTNIQLALDRHETLLKAHQKNLGRMSLGKALVTANVEGRITFANYAAAQILRTESEKLLDASLDEILLVKDKEDRQVSGFFYNVEDSGRGVFEAEGVTLLDTGGNPVLVDIKASPVFDKNRLLLGSFITFRSNSLAGYEVPVLNAGGPSLEKLFKQIEGQLPFQESLAYMQAEKTSNLEAVDILRRSERRIYLLEKAATATQSHEMASPAYIEQFLDRLVNSLVAGACSLMKTCVKAGEGPGLPFRKLYLLAAIAAELADNALLHSKGSSLVLNLQFPEPGQYQLVVKDDGAGFNPVIYHNKEYGLGFELLQLLQHELQAGVELSTARGCRFMIQGKTA